MKKWFISAGLVCSILACSKQENKCASLEHHPAQLTICEQVYDTILKTDTVFTNNPVFFTTYDKYDSVQWQVGHDPRLFSGRSFNLLFRDPETLQVSLTALLRNDCFTRRITASQSLVVLQNDGTHRSPLAGIYKGINTDHTTDTFRVAIRFWKGARYNWWPTGAYSIHNLPQGFKDSTQNFNGYNRPEMDGIVCYSGYRNMAFDRSGNIPSKGVKGYCSLAGSRQDSLIIHYQMIDMDRYNATGSIHYLSKKFVGVRL